MAKHEEDNVVPFNPSWEVSADSLGLASEKLPLIRALFDSDDQRSSRYTLIDDGTDYKAFFGMRHVQADTGLVTYKLGFYREDVGAFDTSEDKPTVVPRYVHGFRLDTDGDRILSCLEIESHLVAKIIDIRSGKKQDDPLEPVENVREVIEALGDNEPYNDEALTLGNIMVLSFLMEGYTLEEEYNPTAEA